MPYLVSTFYSAVIYQIALWLYAALIIFIWYGARFTPDQAILIRVAASILSDIVWIPLGIFLWFNFSLRIFGFVIKSDRSVDKVKRWILALIVVSIFFLYYYEAAFAFLFIPLLFFIIKIVISIPGYISQKKGIAIYVPLLLIVVMTISHYRWQMLPPLTRDGVEKTIKIMSYNIFSQAGFR